MEKYSERPQHVSAVYQGFTKELGVSLQKLNPWKRFLSTLAGRFYLHTQHRLTKEENRLVGFDRGRAEELVSPQAIHDYQTLVPPNSTRN